MRQDKVWHIWDVKLLIPFKMVCSFEERRKIHLTGPWPSAPKPSLDQRQCRAAHYWAICGIVWSLINIHSVRSIRWVQSAWTSCSVKRPYHFPDTTQNVQTHINSDGLYKFDANILWRHDIYSQYFSVPHLFQVDSSGIHLNPLESTGICLWVSFSHSSPVYSSPVQSISVQSSIVSVQSSSVNYMYFVYSSSFQFIPVHSSSFQFIPVYYFQCNRVYHSIFLYISVHSSVFKCSLVYYSVVYCSLV